MNSGTSPKKLDKATENDDDDLPLSPVLKGKRYSRKQTTRKPYKRPEQTTPNSKISSRGGCKSPNSHIPVPVKDYKPHHVTHSPDVPDVHSASSSSLADFREKVIINCKKTDLDKHGSKSDGRAVRAKSPRPKSHKHSKVEENGKHRNNDMLGINALGKTSDVAKISRNDVDMLYENSKFEGDSKTTVESDVSPLSPSSKESITTSSPRNIRKRVSHCGSPPCIKEEPENPINYSDLTTDESNVHAHAQRNRVKSSFLCKNVNCPEIENSEIKAPFLSPTLQQQIREWSDDDKIVDDHSDGLRVQSKANPDGTLTFAGFSAEEIEVLEKKYHRCKEYLHAFAFGRKKKVKRAKEAQQQVICAKSPQREIAVAKCEGTGKNCPDGDKPDETIAVGTNNRVQICIGNNRIQINIKSDKKQDSLPPKNGSQTSSKAIGLSTASKSSETKSNSHGFWSLSTEGSKNKEALDNTARQEANSIDVNAASHLKVEQMPAFSSSGFKSASQTDKQAPTSAKQLAHGDKLSGMITKSHSFDAACEFKTGGGKPLAIKTASLNKVVKTFYELETTSTNSMDRTSTRSSSPTSGNTSTTISSEVLKQCKEAPATPADGRKILKAKSVLGKCRAAAREKDKENVRKSLFQAGNNNDAEVLEFGKLESFNFDFQLGFATASGNRIDLSPQKLQNAAAIFNNLEDNPFSIPKKETKHVKNATFSGFSSAAGTRIQIDAEKMQKAAAMFNGLEFETPKNDIGTNCTTVCNFGGFSSAAGKKLLVDKEKLQKAAAKFNDLEFPDEKCNNLGGFASASGKNILVNSEKLEKAAGIYKNIDLELNSGNNLGGFSSASGKNILVNSAKLEIATGIYQNIGLEFNSNGAANSAAFSSASGKKIHVDPEKLQAAVGKFGEVDNSDTSSTFSTNKTNKTARELIQDAVHTYDKALERLNTPQKYNMSKISEYPPANNYTTPINAVKTSASGKKRLGMSRVMKTNIIPQEKLEKARLLFEECDKDLSITPMKSFCKTPKNKPFIPPSKMPATPVRNNYGQDNFAGRSMTSTPLPSKERQSASNIALDLTPIRTNIKAAKNRRSSDCEEDYDGVLLFREKSCSNFRELQQDIEMEYLRTKRKVEILEERQKALEFQRLVIDRSNKEHSRPRLGLLSITKKGEQRLKLSELSASRDGAIDERILEVSPRNADQLHFMVTASDKPVIRTSDGAQVIPNTKNIIGVTEINNAFQAMNGIEPKLVPKGWLGNHYKWIVWKLAGYERRFPEAFKGCLSVENIVQQLKYRYDREIDKAERPAIRRIMEKDDVPNKRMVLCVADVVQICTNKFELVLTDGWYSIRTVIDLLLCQQIYRGKLSVGTKLIVQGAELLDCDGCHPLEAPEHVKLKICYNNTRRAVWHARLGYYHIATPFALPLRTIHPDGGIAARVKVYVVRIYPVRYMEECNGAKVWRNAKAEEKRECDFDAQRLNELEKIKNKVYDEYESSLKSSTIRKVDKYQLASITCPKELYKLVEASHDPESLYEMMTSSQKASFVNYKAIAHSERQREVSERIAKRVAEMKDIRRSVTPLLKVLVTDALEENSKCTVLNIWRPTDEQLNNLIEERCVSIYNIGVKRSHELTTVKRTMFHLHEDHVYKKCQRQLLPISMTTDSFYKPLFNEFDTVGVIVDVAIRECDQELWLSDFNGRLLYVKVFDGPKVCSLVNNVKLGQSVALCNLVMHQPNSEFGQCVANQYSTLSQFPIQKYLQQGLELFNQQLSDVGRLVSNCQERIEALRSHVNLKFNREQQDHSMLHKLNAHFDDDSMEENETIPSRLTMMDVAMSMMDTDKFL